MKVLKKNWYRITAGLLLVSVIPLLFFITGESQRTPADNLITQADAVVPNTSEMSEQAETPIPTLLPTPIPTPTPSEPPSPSPQTTPAASTNWGVFKSYMSYKAITHKNTLEYQISHKRSTTDSATGIRVVNENSRTYYCVAIGTGWGYQVGDKLIITLSSGNSFYAIMTDTKDNRHTKSDNKTTIADGSVIEFVVGSSSETRKFSWYHSGSLGSLPQFAGGIVSIKRV